MWLCARVASKKEAEFAAKLEERKFEARVPMRTIVRREQNGDGRRKRVRERVVAFPGYAFAFVGPSNDLRWLDTEKTFLGWVRMGGAVVSVSPAIIEGVMALGKEDHTDASAVGLTVGDFVTITTGPFVGKFGRVVKIQSANLYWIRGGDCRYAIRVSEESIERRVPNGDARSPNRRQL